MHRARAILAVVLIGLVVPASAGAPPAPPHPRTFVLDLDYIPRTDSFLGDSDSVSTLVEVDPHSGRPLGRALRLADLTRDEAQISPDRRPVAFGSS